MIPVVMEPSMRNPLTWTKILSAELGGILYVDLCSDEPNLFEEGCRSIGQRIRALQSQSSYRVPPELPTSDPSTESVIDSFLASQVCCCLFFLLL